MASIVPNTFTSFKWENDEEEFGATILTIGNKQRIQNELAIIAQQILNITYDPKETLTFVQQDAHLKGQLQALQWLLDASDAAQTAMAHIQSSSPQS